MKSSLLTEAGRIDTGGKLLIPMERIEEFCREHPGERVLFRLEALGKVPSRALRGYYFGYILPCIRQGYARLGELYTKDQLHRLLWDSYPGERPDGMHEATQAQVSEYIEWLKQFAAENLGVYIDDPQNF